MVKNTKKDIFIKQPKKILIYYHKGTKLKSRFIWEGELSIIKFLENILGGLKCQNKKI